MSKEAKARIKINKLLEEAGWRFFDEEGGKANIEFANPPNQFIALFLLHGSKAIL